MSKYLQAWLSLVIIFLIVSTLSGCAAKSGLQEEPEINLDLQYRMPEGQLLKYRRLSKYTQTMEYIDRPMEVEVNTETIFSVIAKGLKGDNYQLEVTIDSMSAHIVSPDGEFSPNMSAVIGENFDIILSPLGNELDLSGAESIQYDMGAQGKRSIAPDFQAIFPDLAGRPVKIGDTWPAKWTEIDSGNGSETWIDFESVNTLEGYETVNGLECVRVKIAITGFLEGGGEQDGVEISSIGEIKATGTWYFAYKEGIFVKMTTEGVGKITINLKERERDTIIPMTRGFKTEIELIR